MTKAKKNGKGKKAAVADTTNPTATHPMTLADLRSNESLWYRIKLLIHDFHHQKEEVSKARTDEIFDSIYIGTPYFTPDEADIIKAARVSKDDGSEKTMEEVICETLEHRQATTLSAIFPCGPHDMVPVYLECFGIDKSELTDKKFLARVEKSGLQVG